MDLSQPHISPRAAAILASSGVFSYRCHSGDMYLHEVIDFPTYSFILVIWYQRFGHHPLL